MTEYSESRWQEDTTRLRVLRFFSDLCSQRAPEALRQAQIGEVQALETLSDEALSARGLLREDIVDHVFREARFV